MNGEDELDPAPLAAELGRARTERWIAQRRAEALEVRLAELERLYVEARVEARALEAKLRQMERRAEDAEHGAREGAQLGRELIARGGVMLGRDHLERLALSRVILRAFRKRLFPALSAQAGLPYSGIDRLAAPKVMIGTLSSGENEHAQCVAAVAAQTYRNVQHEVFSGLGKAEAVATVMETFQKSDCELMVKVDADMVLSSSNFVERVVTVLQANPEIEMLQMAILDYFSGGPMQGINAYRRTFGWSTERQDALFTDKTGVPTSKRLVVWSTFLRDVVHSPNPSPFQAFHFGVHRGVKVLQPNAADYHVGRAEEQLAYLEKTWRHFHLRNDVRLGFACLGFELALGGRFELSHLDYTNPRLKHAFAEYAGLDAAEVRARVEALRAERVASAEVEAVRARRDAIADAFDPAIRTILMLLPHTRVFGGVNRFFELARQLERLGVRCVIARPDPEPGEVVAPREDFPEVEVRFYSDAVSDVWDVVLCGDGLAGTMLTVPLFSAGMTAAYLLNGWMHAPTNLAQINAIDPDVVIANSSYAAAQLAGVAPTAVPGGIDLGAFHPPTAPRSRSDEVFRVCVYPGRRKERKRFGDALEACRLLRSRGVPVELHAYDQEPIEIRESFPFVFHGALDKVGLRQLLWRVDVMLCPEEDAGWSNPGAEAMACGTPLVCTEAGTTDFALDGQTALVVPTRNPTAIARALERLYREPDLGPTLSARGIEHIRSFEWPQVARGVLDALSCARLDLASRSQRNARAIRRIEALGALERV